MLWDQFYGIADSNLATLNHITIQRERAIELPDDAREHLPVLFQVLRVKGRHDATATKVLNPDDDLSNAQTLPGPRALSQALDPTDHKIRSESPAIMSKSRDRSIRRNQQGQYIEPFDRFIANERGTRPHDIHNIFADNGIIPRQAIDYRFAGLIECDMVAEKSWVRSGRDHMSARILYMHDAIPLDA